MSVDAHSLRIALEDAMELIAANGELRKRVHRLLTEDVKQIVAVMREMDALSRSLGGLLDELARAAQAAERPVQAPNPLAAKALARTLRPILRVLRDPASHTLPEYANAARNLRSVVAQVPREKLLSKGVRGELGDRPGGPHDQLLALLDGDGSELINYLLDDEPSLDGAAGMVPAGDPGTGLRSLPVETPAAPSSPEQVAA